MILGFGYLCIALRAHLEHSLEFPCSVTAKNNHISTGGAALNQIIAAARSGGKTCLIGKIGDDLFGKHILETLRREGIQASGIVKSTEPTGFTTSIANNKNETATILLEGANKECAPEQVPDKMLNQRTLLLLQNDVDTDTNLNILKRAKKNGVRTIMSLSHAKNIAPEFFDHLDIVITKDSLELEIPKKRANHITIKEPENNNGFDAFCGCFAACIQAGLDTEDAKKYGLTANTLTSNENFPYLADIQEYLSKT